MALQFIVVALIVAGCSTSAAWTLMPAAWRRRLAAALLGGPWPAGISGWLRRHATAAASGCGCDGCDHGTAKAKGPAPAVQTIRFHPRPPR